MTETENDNVEKVRAQPHDMPRPTYWPFVLAVSVLFIGWGLLTLWVLSVAGVIGMAIALWGWIKELLYERRNEERKQEKLSR